MSGTLFVVATPIGNLEDLSRRGLTTLERVQTIACEDTRRTGTLLSLLDVRRPAEQRLLACHEHNEAEVVPQILRELRAGKDVALVSDAGTPLLSDPGFALLQAAWQDGVNVVPVPGPSAPLALLSVCPLAAMPFLFAGFLPSKGPKRRSMLVELGQSGVALVLFESPHRVLDCLADIAVALPTRKVFVGREVTKKFEHFYVGDPQQVAEQLLAEDAVRGEFALVIEKTSQADALQSLDGRDEKTFRLLVKELGPSKAAKLMAQLCNMNRSALYDLAQRW